MILPALVHIRNCTRFFIQYCLSVPLCKVGFIQNYRFLFKLFFLFSFLQISHAQTNSLKKNNNNWYFGNKAGLNFNTNPPTVLYDGALNTREGCSAVSDKNSGHLLFYTDGATVWDSTHHSMPNGTGLLGRYDSEQGAIVPYPGHANQYFIFTTTYLYGLYYSVVDMALNAGKGDVMADKKNINLLNSYVASDKVTFTRHVNRRDYWIVAKESYSNVFYVYLLDIYGLHAFDTIALGLPDFAFPQWGGVLKFNRNSNLLINCQAHHDDPLNKSRLQCFGFNAATGQITNVRFTVDSITYPYGAEFSIDNKKLYVSSPFSKMITQYDLEAVNVKNSAIDIFTSNTIIPGQLQMGPDYKIYVPYNNGNYSGSYRYLGVINNPNGAGSQCDFVRDAIDLYPKGSFLGLPQCDYAVEKQIQDTCFSDNLISNGDFENGILSWNSEMWLAPVGSSLNGWYRLSTLTWCNSPDHSTIGDSMFLTSPSFDTTKLLIGQTVTVEPNKSYKFSFWMMNFGPNRPIIKLKINNQVVVSNIQNSQTCVWENFTINWNSNTSTSAFIQLYDVRREEAGNDFALDDISVRKIISCSEQIPLCSNVDTFNCTSLTFESDSSTFCVPILLSADSASFANNEFHFCLKYDTAFVKPTGIYVQPMGGANYVVSIDSIARGELCMTVYYAEHAVFTNDRRVDLGCIQFVLKNEPFDGIKTFDYLSFQIVDGCNNNLQTINAWLTEDNKYWQTENGQYWKLEE